MLMLYVPSNGKNVARGQKMNTLNEIYVAFFFFLFK